MIFKKSFLLFLAFALLSANLAFSQSDEGSDAPVKKTTKKSKRIEIEVNSGSSSVFTIPVGDKGVIIFGESDEHSKDGMKPWMFMRYNTSLVQEFNTNYDVNKHVDFFNYYYDKEKGYVYILLGQEGQADKKEKTARYIYGDVQIIKYNLKNDKISSVSGNLPIRSSVNNFVVKNGIAYFGGNTLPNSGKILARQCLIFGLCCIPGCFFGAAHIAYHPTLFAVDLKKKEFKLETLNYEGDASVVNIASGNEESNDVSVAIANRANKNETAKMYLKNYESGKLISTYNFKAKEDKELTNATIYKVDESENLVFGTYATPLAQQSFFQKISKFEITYNSSDAEGFFISKFVEGKQAYLKKFPFSKYVKFVYESSSLFGKKKTTETAFTSSSNFLLQNVIKKDDHNYILIGDIFIPIYHYVTTYDANGHATTTRVFDGYQFFAALICSFNPEDGTMNWVNTLQAVSGESKDNHVALSFYIRPKVQILQSDNADNIVVAYNDGIHIKSKTIYPDGTSKDGIEKSVNLALANESDKVTSAYDGGDIDYWYDNYFIAYGKQRIKTKGQLFGGRRTVFYFNKIAYRSN